MRHTQKFLKAVHKVHAMAFANYVFGRQMRNRNALDDSKVMSRVVKHLWSGNLRAACNAWESLDSHVRDCAPAYVQNYFDDLSLKLWTKRNG